MFSLFNIFNTHNLFKPFGEAKWANICRKKTINIQELYEQLTGTSEEVFERNRIASLKSLELSCSSLLD